MAQRKQETQGNWECGNNCEEWHWRK